MDNPQNVISFCTGYGGIELGLRRTGLDVRTVCNVEVEAFVQANLVQKIEEGWLDNAPIWSDLKTFPASEFCGKVDGIIGGYPCQPFSSAGKRKGEKDPRHLWPYMRKHLQTIRPTWAFFENVQGHISLGLSTVISDLEEDGYQTAWGIFSAEEAGAPHQRKRVFILAHRKDERFRGGTNQNRNDEKRFPLKEGKKQPTLRSKIEGCCRDARTDELGDSTSERPHRGSENCEGEQSEVLGERLESDAELADSNLDEQTEERGDDGEVLKVPQIKGQKLSPTLLGRGDTDTGSEDTRWPARPGEEQYEWEEPRVTQAKPQLGGATNGAAFGVDPIANRVDRLRLLGNGVVPQTAEIAWKTLWKEIAEENEDYKREERTDSST